MATPYILSPNDPIIQMVRDYNILLSDKGTFSNVKLQSYLNQHAFPRIRGYLLTARSQNHAEVGAMVFYSSIKDLADPTIQATANSLVFQVMTDSIVKDMVYMIAARLAAGWCTTMLAGQIPEQQKIAVDLQKEAMLDLKQLVQSPELTAAAHSAAQAAKASITDKSPRIFMALDVNPLTYDPVNNVVSTYPGAQEVGTANLWVNQYLVSVPVAISDTPAVIMNNLLVGVRTYLASASPGTQFNLVLGPNEGPVIATSKSITIKDPLGNPILVTPQLQTNLGWMSFYAGHHDLIVSALFCTLELMNSSNQLGINGIIYGVMQNLVQLSHPDYTLLSQKGPYSVLIDITPGNGGTAAILKPLAVISNPVYDTFYFQVNTLSGLTTQDGLIKYQIGNIASQKFGVPPRAVLIPRGSNAVAITRLLADDMNKVADELRVLPALRSPTLMQVAGAPLTAPGLRIVAYELSLHDAKLVFDMLEVLSEVVYAAVPSSLVYTGVFDNAPKSIVLDVLYHFPSGKAALALIVEPGATPGARSAQPKLSPRLAQAFQDINYFNRGIF